MAVPSFRVHGVRYQTRDVNRAVEFYTQQLGFELKHQQGAAFASVCTVLARGPRASRVLDARVAGEVDASTSDPSDVSQSLGGMVVGERHVAFWSALLDARSPAFRGGS